MYDVDVVEVVEYEHGDDTAAMVINDCGHFKHIVVGEDICLEPNRLLSTRGC